MSLKLYFHSLSSFCQKALVAFYENDTPFEPHVVDLPSFARAVKEAQPFLSLFPR